MIAWIDSIPWWVWLAGLFLLLLVGFLSICKRNISHNVDLEFAGQFRERFISYVNANGQDYREFNWLMANAPKIQNIMGRHGVMDKFKPPFANYFVNNWQIVVNSLSEIRNNFREGARFGSALNLTGQYISVLDDALLRYLGDSEEIKRIYKGEIKNPILWLRRGVEVVLLLPFNFMVSFGIFPARLFASLRANILFRFMAFLVAVLGISASVIAIVVDGHDAWDAVSKWLLGLRAVAHPVESLGVPNAAEI